MGFRADMEDIAFRFAAFGLLGSQAPGSALGGGGRALVPIRGWEEQNLSTTVGWLPRKSWHRQLVFWLLCTVVAYDM